MDLKNAAAVCLISLFSATLVVLIARALDNQAASQLEPRLVEIAEELRALRAQGGIGAASNVPPKAEEVAEGVVVYYFHGNTRCPTCRSIETQAKAIVHDSFSSQLRAGTMAWKIVNYEQPAAEPLVKKFEVQIPVVVVARMKDGKIADWKRLDNVWALVGDKPAFANYVQSEIENMIAAEKKPAQPPASSAPAKESPSIPIP